MRQLLVSNDETLTMMAIHKAKEGRDSSDPPGLGNLAIGALKAAQVKSRLIDAADD